MAITLMLVLGAILMALSGALVTMPRWFARSVHRHRLWRLRDQVVDDLIDGRLPRHPAVFELIADIERAIADASRVTLLHALIAERVVKRLTPEAERELQRLMVRCPLDGLDSSTQDLIESYRNSRSVLAAGALLLGSWLGVATVWWTILRRRTRTTAPSARQAISQATDEAAVETKLGRAASEVVNEQIWILKDRASGRRTVGVGGA